METIVDSANPTRLPGVTPKPLDNPPRAKPAAKADIENARSLDLLLRSASRLTFSARTGPLPLLNELFAEDSRKGRIIARRLVFVAAAIHFAGDERRTAEYLLRHRDDVIAGRRSALSLLLAARCAAEMEVRRVRGIEIPMALPAQASLVGTDVMPRLDEPSVGELVSDFLNDALGGLRVSPATRCRLLDAVAVAVELSERHTLNGGARPSIFAMRSDARKDARLGASLQLEFGSAAAARALARLLVGSDRSPSECSLLWWAATHPSSPDAVPAPIKQRWIRDLSIADAAILQDKALLSPST